MARDLEDKFAEIVEAIWLEVLAHGWNVADRLFKVAGWTLLIGAIEALYQKTDLIGLRSVEFALVAILFIAVFTSVMNAMIHYQDRASERLPENLGYGWRLLIMVGVNIVLVAGGMMLAIPAIIAAVGVVLEALNVKT
ncbi:MAG: hypothetical protein COW30_07535 [Rhodospirillales bacterium CG15_BIG_FIL_POST_REV_8_21_14_020_66_15]|nr:MAG: hypothetical protein COW30_07535 [Rhodospirillales bacterium CG15_BIG_FIL_POST_REV_8_21_14_020_66_15]